MENKIITDWLDKHGNPEIYKKVEDYLEKTNMKNKIPTAEETYKQITGCVMNHGDIKIAMIEFAKLYSIEFAKWLKHNDNGTDHYNPFTKETSESIGFSPLDCYMDDIMSIEELFDKFNKI